MSVEINDSLWREKLALYQAAFPRQMVEVLNEEWPLLMEVVIKLTPPKTNIQGRAAVARDIYKTMRPFDPAAIRTEGIREIVEKKDFRAYDIVAQRVKSGPMAGTHAVAFSPKQHTSQRNRMGRVGGGYKGRAVVLGTDGPLLTVYVKEVQSRVGWAKSGWLLALRLVGGRRAAAFVERHFSGAGGGFIDDRKNPNDPSITAINRTPWAARRDEGTRIINDALDSRSMSIEKKVWTKLKLAKKMAKFAA